MTTTSNAIDTQELHSRAGSVRGRPVVDLHYDICGAEVDIVIVPIVHHSHPWYLLCAAKTPDGRGIGYKPDRGTQYSKLEFARAAAPQLAEEMAQQAKLHDESWREALAKKDKAA